MAEFLESFSDEQVLEVMLTKTKDEIESLFEKAGVVGYYCVDGFENTNNSEEFYVVGGKKYAIISKAIYGWAVELRENIFFSHKNSTLTSIFDNNIQNLGDVELKFSRNPYGVSGVYVEANGIKNYFN